MKNPVYYLILRDEYTKSFKIDFQRNFLTTPQRNFLTTPRRFLLSQDFFKRIFLNHKNFSENGFPKMGQIYKLFRDDYHK